ncbi:MAG: hypothetical protein KDJ14_00015 [Xanthomonadales bacterium]|nr:hypothetical protein [Xanthomonadales bacterium]
MRRAVAIHRVARVARVGVALVVLMLAACAGRMDRPDLERLYAAARGAQPPVVLVHGVLGSKLRRGNVELWPGGLTRLAFSDYRDLALQIDPATLQPIDDGSAPFALFDRAAGTDFYGAIVRTLEDAGGYRACTPGQPPTADRCLYVFLYDWRQDNVVSAGALDTLIEQIRHDHHDPDLRVDVVAHSNGGLVTRYYARYGTVDLLDGNSFAVTHAGAAKLRRVVLLGTPNFGSLESLKGLIEGVRIGFRRLPPEVLLSMPSAYQLLPHALNTWIISARGEPLQRDLFDATLWRRFQWGVYAPEVRARIAASAGDAEAGAMRLADFERYVEKQLERARRFTWALSVEEPPGGVHPVVLGGDCHLTPARLLVEEVDGESVLRLWPDEIAAPVAGVDYDTLMLEPGDGTVTKASLLAREALDPHVPRHPWSSFGYDYVVFLCERHDQLTGNAEFQDNLLHALLSVDR